jgi:glyoxylase-like metal-dependent hydrolase (beta-lactamase superfamily II)
MEMRTVMIGVASNGLYRNRRLLALTALVVASSAAQAAGPPWESYDTVPLADGIYAFVAPEERGGVVDCNSTVVIGDDGVLVFDTGQFPTLTRKRIADLRKLTDKPVRFVVDSHWHYDHTNGNAEYKDAFPNAVVVSHDFTRAQGAPNFDKYVTKFPDELPKIEAPIRGLLAKGTHADGRPVTAGEREFYAEVLSAGQAVAPEARAARYVPASLTLGDSLTVYLGKREVRLLHLGRGNTAGDVVAYVPDAKLLLTGDAVVSPIPFPFGSYPSEWAVVLRKLAAMDAGTIVPGHGPVQHDNRYLLNLAAMLESLVAQVRAARRDGAALEVVRKKVDLVAFRRQFVGDDPTQQGMFDGTFVQTAVERAYQEIQGKFEPE